MGPFTIQVDQAELDELRRRLAGTRWPEPIPGTGWDYGTDVSWLRDLCAYWADGFDWRAQEERLNAVDHFRAVVDGVRIHYAALGRRGPLVVMIHGFPDFWYTWREQMAGLSHTTGSSRSISAATT